MRVGLTYLEAYTIPWGQLCNLVAIEQFKQEGAPLKENEEDDFFKMLDRE